MPDENERWSIANEHVCIVVGEEKYVNWGETHSLGPDEFRIRFRDSVLVRT